MKTAEVTITLTQIEETERETHVAVDSHLIAQLVADKDTIQEFCDDVNSLKGIDILNPDEDYVPEHKDSLVLYTISEYNQAIEDIA